MGKSRVKLVCMNGGGSSPGEEEIYYFSDDNPETFILLHTSEGRYSFSGTFDGTGSEDVEVLAKLTRQSFSSFSIVFEALFDNIYIEPDYSPKLAGLYDADRISVPQSTSEARHYIHLRPDDIINLREDGLKIRVIAEILNSGSSVQPSSDGNIVVADRLQTEIQVKSSNAGSEQDVSGHDQNDDETDSSDDGLAQTTTDLPARPLGIGEVTPAAVRSINHTIMETPHATTLPKNKTTLVRTEDNEPPYSTANEAPTSDTVLLEGNDVDSPTTRLQMNRAAQVDSLKDSPIAPMEPDKPASTPSGSDLDMEDQTPAAMRTYGGKQNPAVALGQVSDFLIKNTSSDGADRPATQEVEGMVNNIRDSPDPAASSEPLDVQGVASAAASRSTASSTKRKLSDVEEDEASKRGTSSKRQKPHGPKVMQEQHEDEKLEAAQSERDRMVGDATDRDDLSIEKSEEQSDAEDSTPEGDVKPTNSSRRGELARPIRRTTKSTSSKSEEMSNASPTVVVAAQRSTKRQSPVSASPPSSNPSSALAGKIPSILLSHDSPLRKGATAAFLRSKNAPIIDDVKTRRSHFVCVLKGNKLTTTAKVLRSLALGKLVVTEDWITESRKSKELLDPDNFVHPDLKPTIYNDRRTIFQNTNLFFTKTLAKAFGSGWKDIQELAKEAGANHVEEGDSGSFGVFKAGRMDVICFGQKGADVDVDVDVPRLQKSHRVKVYHKNLLTESILKGQLDLDNEKHVL